MVIVADDVALPDNKQPRGIAGTALVHKVAGYAAEQGKSLSEVHEIAQQASRGVFSLGLAMETCNLPGGETEDRIKPGQVELGLGIHGEPGASTVSSHNSKQLIGTLVETLKASAGDNRVAVLINNLGGVSELEMALLTKELAHSALREQIAYLIGPATLVSSLDMKGFSLSLIVLNQVIEEALLADVETSGWVKAVAFAPLRTLTHAKVHDALEVQPSENPQVHALVAQATQTLLGLEARLNALDAKVGDGDTGSTFALGAQDIATQLKQNALPLNNPAQLLQLIGERLATVMGGSSGVLMSLFFTAAGQALAQGETLPDALLAGLKQMKFYGGAAPGDRTLIDALQPALEALRDKGLAEAIVAAQQGADSTATMQKAKAGRASYVNSDNLNGVPDPGAVAVAEVFAAFAKG